MQKFFLYNSLLHKKKQYAPTLLHNEKKKGRSYLEHDIFLKL